MIRVFLIIVFGLSFTQAISQIVERVRPATWDSLAYGGRFMDRFLPMPDLGGMTSNTWGGANVIPRDINNGIEDMEWSYWGGNARLLLDGKYHLFVCRWLEKAPRGHATWPKSIVVHAVADNSYGPYKVVNEVGKGHNPEWFITDDNTYVVNVIDGYYEAKSVDGPWSYHKLDFDKRERKITEGLSNTTFAKREDGSFIMVTRGGDVAISKDGHSTWYQVTDKRIYPPVDGEYEDPLLWKTDVQYHLIVNDWLGRIAYHLRSKDGITWKTDPGEAYIPGLANYKDGTKEDWFKYERIKVLQDEHGRAIQAHFAVIDTLKKFDKAGDNHSSKQIVIPLTVGKLMTVVNKEPLTSFTEEIIVRIKAEKGFNPNTDIDISSLRFGSPEAVDYGRGSVVKSIAREGNDVLITFEGKGNGITQDNFAAKLLGKDTQGNLLFAYSRLPGVNYIQSALSALKPVLKKSGSKIEIEVANFGQVVSKQSTIHVFKVNDGVQAEIGNSVIPPIKPYKTETISINVIKGQKKQKGEWLVIINKGQDNMVSFQVK